MSVPLYKSKGASHWSIGIYTGPSLTELADPPGRTNPVLTARDVDDITAEAVADPFLVRHDGIWFMFLEVLNTTNGRGELAFATSDDGFAWRYGGVVLREPFHLSYPHVFAWEGQFFMTPETRQDGAIRLYAAADFPRRWEFVGVLARGPYADPTIVAHEGRLWMFAQRGLDELRLFSAERPQGPWEEHPQSPLRAGDRRRARPAGRMLRDGGTLYRFAQDGLPNYGRSVRMLGIDRLDPAGYAEHEVDGSPILKASRNEWKWNALGMHHIDAHRLDSGLWLAAVDGRI